MSAALETGPDSTSVLVPILCQATDRELVEARGRGDLREREVEGPQRLRPWRQSRHKRSRRGEQEKGRE